MQELVATRKMGRERTIVSQLRDALLELIKEREMQMGEKLPSEERLTEHFGVSRPALREALKVLEQDGIIRTEHGRGRFLMAGAALHIDRPITTFESVTEMVGGFGYETTTRLLSVKTLEADTEIAAGLHCPEKTIVLRIERVRSDSKRPILYSLDFIRVDTMGPNYDSVDWEGSLVQNLRRRGMGPVASTANVSATILPLEARDNWNLSDFGPVLLVTETCFTAEGIPVLFAKDYHHGKYFKFSFARR